jgi:hypothetical protein
MTQLPVCRRIPIRGMVTALALILLAAFPAGVRAQGPSRAEVLQAQKYLTDRNLLPQLVSLTREDAAQVTRFSDVIVACHRILLEMDQLEKSLRSNEKSSATLRTSLDRIQTQIEGMGKLPHPAPEAATGAETVREADAVAVGDEIVGTMKTRMDRMERILQDMKVGDIKAQRTMTQTRWVSFGSAIFAGLVAILAAI